MGVSIMFDTGEKSPRKKFLLEVREINFLSPSKVNITIV